MSSIQKRSPSIARHHPRNRVHPFFCSGKHRPDVLKEPLGHVGYHIASSSLCPWFSPNWSQSSVFGFDISFFGPR